MIKTVSMFGIRIHPHRSLLFFTIFLLCLLLIYLFNERKNSLKTEELIDDENIHLIDLFTHAFQLTFQAGQMIKTLKNSKTNLKKIFHKKSFQNEPVTIADLLSHSIITNGLKNKFQNLKIVSEEKDFIGLEEIQSIKEQIHFEEETTEVPSIYDDQRFFSVPLSSVAVWIDPLDATKEFTENLVQYVTVMVCVTIENQPVIGIIYSPFTKKFTWGWVGVDHSEIQIDENNLAEAHKSNIDEIIVSRSHAGQVLEILRDIYRDQQYRIIPAAGSAYKTLQVLQEYVDYYLHITPIKKWDVCAPDAILRAHRGTMTTLLNQTIDYNHRDKQVFINDGILVTYKRNHNELLKFLTKSNLTKYLKHR